MQAADIITNWSYRFFYNMTEKYIIVNCFKIHWIFD